MEQFRCIPKQQFLWWMIRARRPREIAGLLLLCILASIVFHTVFDAWANRQRHHMPGSWGSELIMLWVKEKVGVARILATCRRMANVVLDLCLAIRMLLHFFCTFFISSTENMPWTCIPSIAKKITKNWAKMLRCNVFYTGTGMNDDDMISLEPSTHTEPNEVNESIDVLLLVDAVPFLFM